MMRKQWMQKGFCRSVVEEYKLRLRKWIEKMELGKWIKKIISFTFTYFLYLIIFIALILSFGMNFAYFMDITSWTEKFPNIINWIPKKPFEQLPALAVSAAAFIALLTYSRGKEQATSKFFFEQSCQGLDEVYSLLKDQKNDRVIWIRAARSLLQAKKLAEEIELEEYKIAYNLYEDKVRYNLHIALTMPGQSMGQGSPLPAHFFFGLSDWKEDWEAKTDLDEVAKKASSSIVFNRRSLGELPHIPPYSPLDDQSVIAIFDFLDYPKDYKEILNNVKDWNIYWADVSGIKSGAAQYIHHRNTKSAFDGKLFNRSSDDEE